MEWTDIVDIFLRKAQLAVRDGDCDKWIITKKDLNEGAKIIADKIADEHYCRGSQSTMSEE